MSVDRPGINVENLDKTLNALRVIDPEMKKNLNKEMVASVKPIISKVKGRAPSRPARNWGGWSSRGRDLGWNPAVVKRGITTSTANARAGAGGVRSQFRLLNKSAAGAIYETAGSRGGNGTLQSQFFLRNLELQGKAPRLLVRTWREEKGYTVVAGAMRGVANRAEARVNEAIR